MGAKQTPYTKRIRATGITLKKWCADKGFNYDTVKRVVSAVESGKYPENTGSDIGQLIIYSLNMYLMKRGTPEVPNV